MRGDYSIGKCSGLTPDSLLILIHSHEFRNRYRVQIYGEKQIKQKNVFDIDKNLSGMYLKNNLNKIDFDSDNDIPFL